VIFKVLRAAGASNEGLLSSCSKGHDIKCPPSSAAQPVGATVAAFQQRSIASAPPSDQEDRPLQCELQESFPLCLTGYKRLPMQNSRMSRPFFGRDRSEQPAGWQWVVVIR
jgi:hypothetical protein